jgi:hypothetical protein
VLGTSPAVPPPVNTAIAARSAHTLDCSGSATLSKLVECINHHAPPRQHFEGGGRSFEAPSATAREAFVRVFDQMLESSLRGSCPHDVTLPALLSNYELLEFTIPDADHTYCVLAEVRDADGDGFVDRGWGTFIVNPAANRELSIQVPHPKYDTGTRRQGIEVFEKTGARSFAMAGAHRHASLSCSPDQPQQCTAGQKITPPKAGLIKTQYLETDVAHNVASLFQTATERLQHFYGPMGSAADRASRFAVIQLHSMSPTTCRPLDAYISYGIGAPAGESTQGDPLDSLQHTMQQLNPDWEIGVPGQGRCDLDGTDNVQGRLLNGVRAEAAATQFATHPTRHFVHIEQRSAKHRTTARWAEAIVQTWPSDPESPPVSKAGLSR